MSGMYGHGSLKRWRGLAPDRGFTLAEVLISLAILAMGMAIITYGNSSAMSQVSRITRMTTASYLMESVVNDIQDYYVREGFPSNDQEGRDCELPNEFDDVFDCRYDLEAMDLEPAQMQELIQVGMESFTGSMGSLAEGGEEGVSAAMAGADMTQMAALAPLFGPMGGDVMSMCNINISQLMMGITMLSSYMPQIIDQVAMRTRKLTVTMTWDDGPRKQRDFTVETFIVSLPEEEVQAMRDAEMARENAEASGLVNTSAPVNTGNKQIDDALNSLKGTGTE